MERLKKPAETAAALDYYEQFRAAVTIQFIGHNRLQATRKKTDQPIGWRNKKTAYDLFRQCTAHKNVYIYQFVSIYNNQMYYK